MSAHWKLIEVRGAHANLTSFGPMGWSVRGVIYCFLMGLHARRRVTGVTRRAVHAECTGVMRVVSPCLLYLAIPATGIVGI